MRSIVPTPERRIVHGGDGMNYISHEQAPNKCNRVKIYYYTKHAAAKDHAMASSNRWSPSQKCQYRCKSPHFTGSSKTTIPSS